MKTLRCCFLLGALFAVNLFCVQASHAATFTVTKVEDTNDGTCDADCSLREAITGAYWNWGADFITFDAMVFNSAKTITLNSGFEFFSHSITITGPVAGVTLDGVTDRLDLFTINQGANAVFIGLTISNGGAAIFNKGTATIANCTLSGNGSAITNTGTATIKNSHLSGNGGGLSNFSSSTATVTGCTFSGNQVGIYNRDGATATVTNCTLSGNQYGIGNYDTSLSSGGVSNITSCTLSGNEYGIYSDSSYNVGPYYGGTARVKSSLVVGNTTNVQTDFPEAFIDAGHNIIGGTAAEAGLDPAGLQDNGGPTKTIALMSDSPAIDQGASDQSTDQRGRSRPYDNPFITNASNGDGSDIGAYEVQAPALSINNVVVTEGNSGTPAATFTVMLSAPSDKTVTVNATPGNGSARAPGDYVASSATLSFAPGEISKTFSVPIEGDLLDEADEVFYVLLSSPVGAPIARGRGIGTIQDDDAPPSIAIDDISVKEYNGGQATAVFRLRLSEPSGQVVRVNYETYGGTATAGSDYVAVKPTSVTFNTGSLYAYARVLINGDLLNESNETFFVYLSSPLNATLADSQAIGTILNDDSAPSLTINDVSISEGNAGTKNLNFTVTLSKASGQTVTVNYTTADGTALSASDYVAENGVLRFIPASGLIRQISIAINGDTVVENDETLYLLLSGATNASIGRARGIGTIQNDDSSG